MHLKSTLQYVSLLAWVLLLNHPVMAASSDKNKMPAPSRPANGLPGYHKPVFKTLDSYLEYKKRKTLLGDDSAKAYFRMLSMIDYLPLTGGTLTGGLTIQADNPLFIGSTNYPDGFMGANLNDRVSWMGDVGADQNNTMISVNDNYGYIVYSAYGSNPGHRFSGNVLFNDNVGIGTTGPLEKLHIKGGAVMSSDPDFDNINVRMDGRGVPIIRFTRWPGGANAVQNNAYIGQFSNPGLSEYSFGIGTGISTTGDQTAATTAMTITTAGNVGIGTIMPGAKLTISGYGQSMTGTPSILDLNASVPGDRARLSIGSTSGTVKSAGIMLYGFNDAVTTYENKWEIANDLSENGDNNLYFYNVKTNSASLFIGSNGSIGIGTTVPGSDNKLSVEGTIGARKVKVTQAAWADYVFDSSYQLKPLAEVAKYIKENKHLPEVPTTEEVKKEGIDVGNNQALLLKKIEELTLYMIEMKKENEQLKKRIESLEKGKN